MRELPVRRVHDGVDTLVQQASADNAEDAARRYFFLREDFLRFGTFPPARRASDSPMAIACLRLFTRLPERPLLSVPCLRLCIARFTLLRAFVPYLAMATPWWCYSTFAFALSPRTSSSTLFCTSCCWMRGLTSASAGNFTCRTSSS